MKYNKIWFIVYQDKYYKFPRVRAWLTKVSFLRNFKRLNNSFVKEIKYCGVYDDREK